MIEVSSIAKVYGRPPRQTVAIADVSFAVDELEFVSLVGPSGCGKTTLLKCMAGLLAPTAGETRVAGKVVREPPEQLAIVFQDYQRSLFPWLTVRANVELPLLKKLAKAPRREVVDRVTAAVGLERFRAHHPWQLSGGMQQRVAIARALAYEPKVLLLDEPFASVDAQTRATLEDLVLSLRRQFAITTLLVTHDIDEAVYMSDRVLVLTHQPSVIRDTLSVELPWPRDQIDTKAMAEFSELRGRVYHEIMQAHPDEGEPAPEPVDAPVAGR